MVTKEGAILSDRVTFNVKKMVAADAAGKSTAGYLGNLKGAYTEDFLKTDIAGETIKDISHINKGGLDYVALDEYVLKIVEAKARQSLRVKDIKNYVKTDKNGVVTNFNADYAIGELGEDYFKNLKIQKQFVLYLNGPNSQTIKNSLNLPASLPYKFTSGGKDIRGTIEIVVMAVNK